VYNTIKISEFLLRKKEPIRIDPDKEYRLVTVKMHHNGVVLREKKRGSLLGSNMYKVSKGQFILSGIDARNGAFGIVPDELDGAIVTNDFWYFDVDETKVLRDFFYWLTNTPMFLDACIKSSKGETQRIRLQKDLFYNFEFHFPPINKQKLFLERFNKIDDNESLLQNELINQSSHLSLLRQAILQEAIEGKLTAEWRKSVKAHGRATQGDPEYDAAALLEKIKADKQKLIADGKIRKEKPLALIKPVEVPFPLPEGWAWCRLGEISSDIHYGFTASANERIQSPKMLRITDIQDNKVDWNMVPGCQIEKSVLPKYCLSHGDILIARTGGTIGKTFLIEDCPSDSVFASYLIRFIPMKNINIHFAKFFMESPIYWLQLKQMSWGGGQPNVNASNLQKMNIPLPPLSEQKAIVERVDRLMAMVDELETQVKERKEQAERLMQAVLREAFEG
jgi:type I restriction enzyme S subunit